LISIYSVCGNIEPDLAPSDVVALEKVVLVQFDQIPDQAQSGRNRVL